MKAVILAGGYGTRISEESAIRPKPMVEIGGKPILWHIMKIYSTYGINEFIICLGYKGEIIKDYFANYHLRRSDVFFDLNNHSMEIMKNGAEKWKVYLIETGQKSMTGERLRRVRKYINNETFCLTYGDGVSNVNVEQLINFHKKTGALATVTSVQPPGRFGALNLIKGSNKAKSFREKPEGDSMWINGGFFVLEPKVLDLIENDNVAFEDEPMRKLARMGQLAAFKHNDFWHPMDTLRDKNVLEELWQKNQAPWKVWR